MIASDILTSTIVEEISTKFFFIRIKVAGVDNHKITIIKLIINVLV